MLLPLEEQVGAVEVHNDLIVLISCQVNTEVIPRLKGIDGVEVEEGIMPASKGATNIERLINHSQYSNMFCLDCVKNSETVSTSHIAD